MSPKKSLSGDIGFGLRVTVRKWRGPIQPSMNGHRILLLLLFHLLPKEKWNFNEVDGKSQANWLTETLLYTHTYIYHVHACVCKFVNHGAFGFCLIEHPIVNRQPTRTQSINTAGAVFIVVEKARDILLDYVCPMYNIQQRYRRIFRYELIYTIQNLLFKKKYKILV